MSKHVAKQQHSFPLTAVKTVGKQSVLFETTPAGFSVAWCDSTPDRVTLTTPKGKYTLIKHRTLGYYHGVCGGFKVQVSLKVQVGELRAWY
jgi:hypothetical protein